MINHIYWVILKYNENNEILLNSANRGNELLTPAVWPITVETVIAIGAFLRGRARSTTFTDYGTVTLQN